MVMENGQLDRVTNSNTFVGEFVLSKVNNSAEMSSEPTLIDCVPRERYFTSVKIIAGTFLLLVNTQLTPINAKTLPTQDNPRINVMKTGNASYNISINEEGMSVMARNNISHNVVTHIQKPLGKIMYNECELDDIMLKKTYTIGKKYSKSHMSREERVSRGL